MTKIEKKAEYLALKSIFNNLEVSINIFDKKGKRIFVNPYFYHLTGRKMGSKFSDNMMVGEDKKKAEQLTKKVLKVIRTGKIIRVKHFFYHNRQRRKISRKYFDFLIGPIRDDKQEIIGAYTMVSDSTARFLANKRLHRLNAELEKKVSDRTRELAIKSKEKDRLVSDIAHEIKTILTIIKGNLEILEMEKIAKNPIGIECYNEIQSEIKRMSQVASDLVFIARSERYAETFKFQNLDLCFMLRNLVNKYTVIAGTRISIVLKYNRKEHLTIRADRDKLIMLFGNMIENAIKFGTNKNAKLWIIVSRRDSYAEIIFNDNGMGIDIENIDFIFNPFFQAKKTYSQANKFDKGFGLGLAICKKIAEAHKGKITASSNGRGKGAKFRIVLPIEKHAVK